MGDQVFVEGVLGTEIGRIITELPDNIAEKRAFPFEIFLDDTIVADQGE